MVFAVSAGKRLRERILTTRKYAHSAQRKGEEMKTEKQRWQAWLLCILVAFVTFSSLFYVVEEQQHSCTGEDCPICACLQQAEQTLRTLGSGTAVPAMCGFVLLKVMQSVRKTTVCVLDNSPVSRKVRLNN